MQFFLHFWPLEKSASELMTDLKFSFSESGTFKGTPENAPNHI